jgi:hypothetical protein
VVGWIHPNLVSPASTTPYPIPVENADQKPKWLLQVIKLGTIFPLVWLVISLSSEVVANRVYSDGGVNPLSALYIIDEMLSRLRFDIGSEEDLLASGWFDLIIGSGHGG